MKPSSSGRHWGCAAALICASLATATQADVVFEDEPTAPSLTSAQKATASSAAAAMPFPIQVAGQPAVKPGWIVRSGSLLRETLSEWCKQEGWAIVWNLSDKEDFRLEAGHVYPNDFKSAVAELINSLPAKVRIRVELRPDNSPPLLYVTKDEGGI